MHLKIYLAEKSLIIQRNVCDVVTTTIFADYDHTSECGSLAGQDLNIPTILTPQYPINSSHVNRQAVSSTQTNCLYQIRIPNRRITKMEQMGIHRHWVTRLTVFNSSLAFS